MRDTDTVGRPAATSSPSCSATSAALRRLLVGDGAQDPYLAGSADPGRLLRAEGQLASIGITLTPDDGRDPRP
ncbi:MAG: hypothetical protein U5R48_15120 [Gammaproteobacteria bacterium]|nr:hypothetical protein [Gammaproteobacteria bacterium]